MDSFSLEEEADTTNCDKDKAEGDDKKEKGNLKDKEELPEEEARKRRLEYILKRSEFYTKKLTAGGIGGLTSGGKAATANLNSTAGSRRRTRVKKDDADLYLMESITSSSSKGPVIFDSSPGFIAGGEMRDYQVRGLNWLVNLYENGINGILADEMGLGKTLQSISVLGYLKHVKGLKYHALIIVPKSTLSNWMNEFKRWCPTIRALAMIGDKVSRQKLIKEGLKKLQNWDVLVTTYEMVLMEKAVLKKIHWGYLIIDEAHRIKNEQSLLAKVVRTLRSRHRLLLTGTPLQNNLHELWALLNFLLPEAFSSAEDFSSWFAEDEIGAESEGLVKRLHTILRPFLLRRLKSEVEKGLPPKIEKKVYVGLSQMQHQCYRDILLNQFNVLNSEGKMSHQRLANIVIQLRKCCNHPYLFRGQEPGPPYTCEPHLFTNCGKMLVMDKLLEKLKQEGSRVLLFSSMARMLDILEDYCFLKKIKYHRLDGSTEYTERQKMIDEFNSPGSETFLFMLTTRAGGLGINLASADCVVIYDSDWNPMVDLQAMDRAHRIGQTKEVRVFRLITEDSVEERIVQRAALKLKLDNVVIQQGRIVDKSQNVLSSADLLSWIRHSAKSILSSDGVETIADETIQEILSKSEAKSGKVDEAINALPESKLATFTIDSQEEEKDFFDFGGENFRRVREEHRRKQREAKTTSGYFDVDENVTGSQRASKKKALKTIKEKSKEITKDRDKKSRTTKVPNVDPESSSSSSDGNYSDKYMRDSNDLDEDWTLNPDEVKRVESEEEWDTGEMNDGIVDHPVTGMSRGSRKSNLPTDPEEIAKMMAASFNKAPVPKTIAVKNNFHSMPDSAFKSLYTEVDPLLKSIMCKMCGLVILGTGNVASIKLFRAHFKALHFLQIGPKPVAKLIKPKLPRPILPALPSTSRPLNLLMNNGHMEKAVRMMLEKKGQQQGQGQQPPAPNPTTKYNNSAALARMPIDFFKQYYTPLDGDARNYSSVECKLCKKVLKANNAHTYSSHFRRKHSDVVVPESSNISQIDEDNLANLLNLDDPDDPDQSPKPPAPRQPRKQNLVPRIKSIPPSEQPSCSVLSQNNNENTSDIEIVDDEKGEKIKIRIINEAKIGKMDESDDSEVEILGDEDEDESENTGKVEKMDDSDISEVEILPDEEESSEKIGQTFISYHEKNQVQTKTTTNKNEIPGRLRARADPVPTRSPAKFPTSCKAVNRLSKTDLKQYYNLTEEKKFRCTICDVEEDNITKFRWHLMIHIEKVGSKSKTKSSCENPALSLPEGTTRADVDVMEREELLQYGDVLEPSGDFRCNICSLVFKCRRESAKFKKHLKSHVGDQAESSDDEDPGAITPLLTLPEGTTLSDVNAMEREDLLQYCEYLEPQGDFRCKLCSARLKGRNNISKFRIHLRSHIAKVSAVITPASSLPEGITVEDVDDMDREDLLQYGDILEPSGDFRCHLCTLVLKCWGNISKFRRHLRAHVVNGDTSPIRALKMSTPKLNLTLPPSSTFLTMGNDELREFCTFLPNGNISCNICKIKLRAQSNISKFKRHLFSTHNTNTVEDLITIGDDDDDDDEQDVKMEEEDVKEEDDDEEAGFFLGEEIVPDASSDKDCIISPMDGSERGEEDKAEESEADEVEILPDGEESNEDCGSDEGEEEDKAESEEEED
ncbi:putative global transcription activator SNF2L1 [Folsomia candida]|nr:putative global transcription activator SNF2L1 [Folsomia candida]